ncbi:pinin/SDK/memA/ protein conserved region-domain-containing protein [Cladorrhinum samala]|uniref:Pinin/SDK/memA/ protein conserved region-domain-containing protein n=1 Tax=Cladorrhinum samala TaxID=585594 RepID=A0AAV9H847_9PEZI|nr:pinin/SDK/memA/ protein conserved region-domain-containing protein [Cladorrhinum samala]
MAGGGEDNNSTKQRVSPSPRPESKATKRARPIDSDYDDDIDVDRGSRKRVRHKEPLNYGPQSPSARRPSSFSSTNDVYYGDHPRSGRSSQDLPNREDSSRRPPPASTPAEPPTKKPVTQEDKKRGQRLFGGMLGILSQTSTSSHQKRRAEIERRQQERAQKQKEEGVTRRDYEVLKLNHDKHREQIKFEMEVMSTRHSHLLAKAHFLQTRCEPRIFYAPWELTKPQHRTVERQVRDAKEQIRREVEEFNAKKNREINELSEALDWGQAVAFKAKNQPPREEPKVALDEDDEAGGSKAAEGLERREDCVKLRWPSSGTGAHFNTMRPQSSNDDEVMVEREDTVIY